MFCVEKENLSNYIIPKNGVVLSLQFIGHMNIKSDSKHKDYSEMGKVEKRKVSSADQLLQSIYSFIQFLAID